MKQVSSIKTQLYRVQGVHSSKGGVQFRRKPGPLLQRIRWSWWWRSGNWVLETNYLRVFIRGQLLIFALTKITGQTIHPLRSSPLRLARNSQSSQTTWSFIRQKFHPIRILLLETAVARSTWLDRIRHLLQNGWCSLVSVKRRYNQWNR